MDKKEVLYTNELGVRRWESGEVFQASLNQNNKNDIRFEVSSEYVVERNNDFVNIDTYNDADL